MKHFCRGGEKKAKKWVLTEEGKEVSSGRPLHRAPKNQNFRRYCSQVLFPYTSCILWATLIYILLQIFPSKPYNFLRSSSTFSWMLNAVLWKLMFLCFRVQNGALFGSAKLIRLRFLYYCHFWWDCIIHIWKKYNIQVAPISWPTIWKSGSTGLLKFPLRLTMNIRTLFLFSSTFSENASIRRHIEFF